MPAPAPAHTPPLSPLRIIREELPRFLNEPHAADFREVISALVPQTPSELAMEVAFSPLSKPARLASLAASALAHSPEAEGAPLAKIAKWYDDAVSQILKRRTHDAGEPDDPNLSGRITGHEGRHQAYAIEDLYGPDIEMPGGLYNPGGTDRVPFFTYPETPDPQDPIHKRSMEMPRSKYADGGLVERLKSFGFSPEDVDYALDRFEEEREYLPHRGATNYESRPERYLIMPPHKIVPKEEWKYGSSFGGIHNFLEGIQVPNRSWNWVLPEVLTHEAQHANVGALPLEELTRREETQKGILNKLMDYVKPLHPAKYPAGVTGRELVQELAPELIAAEGYLPAGQSLIHSELGQRIFQSPEEKLWYMSRRYPPMRDPEVKNGYLDAITGAAPR